MIDFLARASANSLPIIPAWDLTLWKCGNEWAMMTGGTLWQWIGGHLPGCGGGGGLGVRAFFNIWCI